MYTILQISDLHRSSEEPVDNSTLVVTLLDDADRYSIETPLVGMPDAIVVSGDLVQGVPINQSNWQKSMASQYEIAEDFINQLVSQFLEGDKSKIAIVPGNHDVCWRYWQKWPIRAL